MANQLNTGTLEALKPGQTLLINARKVANDKLHLEFAEIIKSGTQIVSVLALLNKSDDRFSSNARRAWVTAEPSDATEYFGVDFGPTAGWYASERGEMLDLDILNPTMDGIRCRVIIDETTEATDWQQDNVAVAAKRKGKDGEYITHQGAYIFSNTLVTLTDEENTDDMHNFLTPDSQTMIKSEVEEISKEVDEEIESMI